ncbi:unnamed protein product [Cyprideis torosa]|uniref:Cytochrome c oxidase assembly protein COX11, mitochondrial n=1 Tax=Cyprideis torosa TaxID=163714 RepID=A0A7R8WUU3_9CRUS|nr:unnamed protein product [Cyprideis torosa]CAG0910836.1 unnamed protein product [Cyprideis torosa]
MKPVNNRLIRISFRADTAGGIRWKFQPQQSEVHVRPGETALAFYTATNPTDKAIDGISTYNVVPFEAGQYFNKIQCFCFEEQRLNPHEQVYNMYTCIIKGSGHPRTLCNEQCRVAFPTLVSQTDLVTEV